MGTTGVAVSGGEVTISGKAEITGTEVASDPDQEQTVASMIPARRST